MPFEVRPLDITEYKGDAIVNSLGIHENINVYGQICQSIVDKCGSVKIKKEIAKHINEADPGYLFITEGYKLPSKNIIHVCTPYFHFDPDLYALEFVYKSVLVLAFKNKWFKLGLPIIGMTNGYPHAYIYEMVVEIVKAFCNLHKEMQVTICVPVISVEDLHQKFDKEEIDKSIDDFFEENKKLKHRSFKYTKNSFMFLESFEIPHILEYSRYEIREPHHREDFFRVETRRLANRPESPIKPKKEFLPAKEVLLEAGNRPVHIDMANLSELSVTYYIDKYIEARFTNPTDQKVIRKHVNSMISGDNFSTSLRAKHAKESKRVTIPVHTLMRYILALHMNEKEANDFLLFCGRAFSPVSNEDQKYQELINKKKYVTREHDIAVINGYCLKYNINLIFGHTEPLEE